MRVYSAKFLPTKLASLPTRFVFAPRTKVPRLTQRI